MKKKNKEIERGILHEYMVYLHNEHGCEAPDRVSSAMCEIYNTLHRRINYFGLFCLAVTVNSLVRILIFVINFFRSET